MDFFYYRSNSLIELIEFINSRFVRVRSSARRFRWLSLED